MRVLIQVGISSSYIPKVAESGIIVWILPDALASRVRGPKLLTPRIFPLTLAAPGVFMYV